MKITTGKSLNKYFSNKFPKNNNVSDKMIQLHTNTLTYIHFEGLSNKTIDYIKMCYCKFPTISFVLSKRDNDTHKSFSNIFFLEKRKTKL